MFSLFASTWYDLHTTNVYLCVLPMFSHIYVLPWLENLVTASNVIFNGQTWLQITVLSDVWKVQNKTECYLAQVHRSNVIVHNPLLTG